MWAHQQALPSDTAHSADLWSTQHLLAVLRTPKMDSITLSLPTQQAPRLTIQLACPKTGTTPSFSVVCLFALLASDIMDAVQG